MITTKEFNDLYKKAENNAFFVSRFESVIYGVADNLSEDYESGLWVSEQIKNDEGEIVSWFFSLKSEKPLEVANNFIQSNSIVSPKCFSAICFVYAVSSFLEKTVQIKKLEDLNIELVNLCDALKDNIGNVLSKKETKIFFQVID